MKNSGDVIISWYVHCLFLVEMPKLLMICIGLLIVSGDAKTPHNSLVNIFLVEMSKTPVDYYVV